MVAEVQTIEPTVINKPWGLMSEHSKKASYRLHGALSVIPSYVKAWVSPKAIHVDNDCSNIKE